MNSPLGGHHWKMKTLFDLPERFQKKIAPCPATGCWLWVGSVMDRGYGRARAVGERKNKYTHRAVYELLVGDIPDGLQIDHLCRNRVCCNPLHLEPVTCRENLRRGDGPSAICARKTHCKRGHEFSKENTAIRGKGKRSCRICELDRSRSRDQKRTQAQTLKRKAYSAEYQRRNADKQRAANRKSYAKHREEIRLRRKLARHGGGNQ